MTATEYLEQIKTARLEVEYCRQKINDLRDMAQRISGCGFEEHNNANHPTEARFVKYLADIEEMETELSRRMEKYMAIEVQVTQILLRLPNPQERQVLELIYLHGLTVREVAQQMCYSIASVKRQKANALASLEKMIPFEPK